MLRVVVVALACLAQMFVADAGKTETQKRATKPSFIRRPGGLGKGFKRPTHSKVRLTSAGLLANHRHQSIFMHIGSSARVRSVAASATLARLQHDGDWLNAVQKREIDGEREFITGFHRPRSQSTSHRLAAVVEEYEQKTVIDPAANLFANLRIDVNGGAKVAAALPEVITPLPRAIPSPRVDLLHAPARSSTLARTVHFSADDVHGAVYTSADDVDGAVASSQAAMVPPHSPPAIFSPRAAAAAARLPSPTDIAEIVCGFDGEQRDRANSDPTIPMRRVSPDADAMNEGMHDEMHLFQGLRSRAVPAYFDHSSDGLTDVQRLGQRGPVVQQQQQQLQVAHLAAQMRGMHVDGSGRRITTSPGDHFQQPLPAFRFDSGHQGASSSTSASHSQLGDLESADAFARLHVPAGMV